MATLELNTKRGDHVKRPHRSFQSASFVAETLLCLWIFSFSLGITKISVLPVKTLILLAFLLFTSLALLNKRRLTVRHRWSLLTLWPWIVFSIYIGISNGFLASTASQSLSLTSAFLAAIFVFLLHDNTDIDVERIKKLIYTTAIAGMAAKCFIGIGAIIGVFSADSVDEAMQSYLGSASYNVDILGGFLGLLPRIGNAGDLFFLIAFLFYAKEHRGAKVAIFWLLALVFVVISYSRYLMVFFLLETLYLAAISARGNPKVIAIFAVIAIGALKSDYLDVDAALLEIVNRFTGQIQYESDSIRIEMTNILFRVFAENPLWGIGMGGHAPGYLRSYVNLWQYELEYLSLLMQFGILGFIFVVANFAFYALRIIFSGYNKALFWPMVASAIFWLGTPLQSSIFCGTQSALIIMTIFFLSRESRHENELARATGVASGANVGSKAYA